MRSRTTLLHLVQFSSAAVVAAVVLVFAPAWLSGAMRAVAAYDAAVLVLLAWLWRVVLRRDAADSRERSASEDPGANVVLIVVLAAVAFGFFAAIEILGRGPHGVPFADTGAAYALGFGAVVLGWLLIHTIFLFRYARLYYNRGSRGKSSAPGLLFPGGEPPSDLDFAYFSFVIGMTFQVSDVQIAAAAIRRLALAHALISFAYNTAILALVVNVVAGLFH